VLDLTKKTALVTGAGTRVGAAIARALGSAGMFVGVHYFENADGARRTADAVRAAGGDASIERADLRDPEACAALVAQLERARGGLDVLVASAANYQRVAFDAIAPLHLREAFALNVEAALWLARAAAPALRSRKGSIAIVTDAALARPPRDYLPYLLSKGAASTLVRALAVELAPDVRVNGVAPGTVLPPEGMDDDQLAPLARATALGRIGRPEDVADAVVHLSRATFVTGQELVVDGGAYA
jgi:pteridine reductase